MIMLLGISSPQFLVYPIAIKTHGDWWGQETKKTESIMNMQYGWLQLFFLVWFYRLLLLLTPRAVTSYIQRINSPAAFVDHPQTVVTIALWNDRKLKAANGINLNIIHVSTRKSK